MVDDTVHHFEEIAGSGGDSVTFHVEATGDPAGVAEAARGHGLGVGVAFNPKTTPADAAAFARAADAEIVLCMSIVPATRARLHAGGMGRIAISAPSSTCRPGGRWCGRGERRAVRRAGASLLVCGSAIFAEPDPARHTGRLRPPRCGSPRARDRAGRAWPGDGVSDPVVGAVVVAPVATWPARAGTDRRGGPHAEINACAPPVKTRAAARSMSRSTLQPLGRRPACTDAVIARGSPESSSGRSIRIRWRRAGPIASASAGIEVEFVDCSRREGRTRPGAGGEQPAAVRDVQGRGHDRRPRDGARVTLGDGGDLPPAGSRASRRGGRGRRRNGNGAGRCTASRCAGRRDRAVTAAPRVRPRPAAGGLGAQVAPGSARRGARGARRGGGAVAPAGGGPTLAAAFFAEGSRRQADRIRRTDALGRRASPLGDVAVPVALTRLTCATGRRGRPRRGVRARAVARRGRALALRGVHRDRARGRADRLPRRGDDGPRSSSRLRSRRPRSRSEAR